jgi:hypothetical protein
MRLQTALFSSLLLTGCVRVSRLAFNVEGCGGVGERETSANHGMSHRGANISPSLCSHKMVNK